MPIQPTGTGPINPTSLPTAKAPAPTAAPAPAPAQGTDRLTLSSKARTEAKEIRIEGLDDGPGYAPVKPPHTGG